MKKFISAILFLTLFPWQVLAATGDVFTTSGTAFTNISTPGSGRIKATKAKDTLTVQGSGAASVTIDALTKALTIYAPPPIPACAPGGPMDGYTPQKGIDYNDGVQGPIGHSYTCGLVGGVTSITYDQYGLNPTPDASLFPFTVLFYEDGFLRPPDHWTWETTPGQAVYGSATTATFIPSILGNYSSGNVNGSVTATVKYKGQVCKATVSVSVTKVGQKGEKGDTGPAVNVNQALLLGEMEKAGGHTLWRQPLAPQANADAMFGTKDLMGNVSGYWTGGGMIVLQDPNSGVIGFSADSTGVTKGAEPPMGNPPVDGWVPSKNRVGSAVTWIAPGGASSETRATIVGKINQTPADNTLPLQYKKADGTDIFKIDPAAGTVTITGTWIIK